MLKIGVCGLGFGASVHLPALQSIQGIKVVAICGQDKNKLEKISNDFSIPTIYQNPEKMIKNEQLDVVILALPPFLNEKICQLALKKGIHIFMEKPLATKVSYAENLADLAKNKKVIMDFEFAEYQSFEKLRKIIKSNQFGKVLFFKVDWIVGSQALRKREWSWKTDNKLGGGVLNLLGTHFFYLVEHFFGDINSLEASADNSVTSSFSSQKNKAAEDLVLINLKLKSGIYGNAVISNSSPVNLGHKWTVVCEQGVVELFDPCVGYSSGFSLSVISDGRKKIIFKEKISADSRIKAVRRLMVKFFKSIKLNNEIVPNFNDGLRVQVLVAAAIESHRKGKKIFTC